MPRSDDITNLSQTVSKLMLILDRLKASPEQIDACKIDCFFVVGSLRMGTMVRDHRIADMVIILQTLPVKAALSALGNKLLEELQRIEPTNPYQINLCDDNLELTNLFNRDIIRILIATTTANLNKLDREIHVRKNAVQRHLKATVHARWFEENIKWNDVRDFIRLFKDVCGRFKEFSYFSPWMIIILCHYSMTCTSGTSGEDNLPIHLAFKRLLQLLSSGIFLPYSAGITDPCEPKMPIHGKLSVYDQETISRQAQTLLRLLNYHNGCRYVFGLERFINNHNIQHDSDNDSDNSSSSSSKLTSPSTSATSTAIWFNNPKKFSSTGGDGRSTSPTASTTTPPVMMGKCSPPILESARIPNYKKQILSVYSSIYKYKVREKKNYQFNYPSEMNLNFCF